MKRHIRFVIIIAQLLLVSALAFAQSHTSFLEAGNRAAARGDFMDAQNQFEAALAMLDVKRVDKNSSEYIAVEKKIAYAKQCASLKSRADAVSKQFTDLILEESFAKCQSQTDVMELEENLLSKVNSARKDYKEILSRFSTDATSRSALARCDAAEDKITKFSHDFPEIMAWNQACQQNSLDAYEKFLTLFPQGNYVAACQSRINSIKDERRWEYACKENSISSYRGYLDSFPKGVHAEDARARLNDVVEDLAWRNTLSVNTSEAYKEYIAKYPNGSHVSMAKKKYALAAEDEMWEKQIALNTKSGYNKYLQTYPKGRYVADARNRIGMLEERSVWAKVEEENTISAYKRYLETSKHKYYKKQAEEKIAKLEHEQRVKADENLWQKTKSLNTVQAYDEYLNTVGLRTYRNQAIMQKNLLLARALKKEYKVGNNSEKILEYYNTAKKYGSLSAEDMQLFGLAEEYNAYMNCKSSYTEAPFLAFFRKYPNSKYTNDLKDLFAMLIARNMNATNYVEETARANSYVVSSDAKKYVRDRSHIIKRAVRKSSITREDFHFLAGFEVRPYFYLSALNGTKWGNDVYWNISPILSFGGHSNRFNLELGFDYPIGGVYMRPKWNFVRKKPQLYGYSPFYMYIAPEVGYYFLEYDGLSYGAKLGLGVYWLDLGVGVLRLEGNTFLTASFSVYFGNK